MLVVQRAVMIAGDDVRMDNLRWGMLIDPLPWPIDVSTALSAVGVQLSTSEERAAWLEAAKLLLGAIRELPTREAILAELFPSAEKLAPGASLPATLAEPLPFVEDLPALVAGAPSNVEVPAGVEADLPQSRPVPALDVLESPANVCSEDSGPPSTVVSPVSNAEDSRVLVVGASSCGDGSPGGGARPHEGLSTSAKIFPRFAFISPAHPELESPLPLDLITTPDGSPRLAGRVELNQSNWDSGESGYGDYLDGLSLVWKLFLLQKDGNGVTRAMVIGYDDAGDWADLFKMPADRGDFARAVREATEAMEAKAAAKAEKAKADGKKAQKELGAFMSVSLLSAFKALDEHVELMKKGLKGVRAAIDDVEKASKPS
jgi:hypothetical protein